MLYGLLRVRSNVCTSMHIVSRVDIKLEEHTQCSNNSIHRCFTTTSFFTKELWTLFVILSINADHFSCFPDTLCWVHCGVFHILQGLQI